MHVTGDNEMTEEPKPKLVQERLAVCELDRARMSLLNPALIAHKKEERTIDENAKPVLRDVSTIKSRKYLIPISRLLLKQNCQLCDTW
jgi:hypothetical protein